MSRFKLAGQIGSVALVGALLVLLVWKVVQNDRTNVASSFTKGHVTKPADFDLTRLNGNGKLQLSSLRGKVVVVNFWASWCEPCKSEAPRFQQAFERYGVTYPNVRDPDRSVLGRYGGLPIPRTFVISPNWRVTGYIFGEARSEEIDSAIQEALGA